MLSFFSLNICGGNFLFNISEFGKEKLCQILLSSIDSEMSLSAKQLTFFLELTQALLVKLTSSLYSLQNDDKLFLFMFIFVSLNTFGMKSLFSIVFAFR